MDTYVLLAAAVGGIALLLFCILYLKVHPFIALFLASIFVGIFSGMPQEQIVSELQKGMAGTLGFVAGVVGLGAMFGALLEHSGGAYALADFLVAKGGEKGAPWAMAFTGFLVGIPVFFEVAFIILFPMAVALHKKSGKSLLLYGLPLLAGLAVSHAFIPPSPGSIAVAEIIGANLGWVILTGIAAGIPGAILAGPVFANFISKKIEGSATFESGIRDARTSPSVALVLTMICIPIALIVVCSLLNSPMTSSLAFSPTTQKWINFVGHPFVALLLSNLLAWYFLGIKQGYTKEQLLKITSGSLAPAGSIILIIGAGGMFKQILATSGVGTLLAESIRSSGASYILFGFGVAALIRIIQGSATVAMITAAGMTASLVGTTPIGELEKALIVTAISSGATILSHVNDGGFWLVGRYFGINEKQTLSSWTVTTTIIAMVGLMMVLLMEFMFVR